MITQDVINFMLNKPVWFRLSDLLLGFISIILAFLISHYVYCYYKTANKKNLLHFSNAFFLLGISAAMLFMFNLVMFLKGHMDISTFLFSNTGMIMGAIFIFLFILVTVSAFLNLVFITLGDINNKTKLLIFMLVFMGVLSVFRSFVFFYGMVLIFLLFLLHHSIVNYIKTRHFLSLGFLVAMLFMALSFAFNIFVPANELYYAIANVLSFLSLAVIMAEIRILSKACQIKKD